nr:GxxExxY protein [Thioalkalivibrio denitrificans]
MARRHEAQLVNYLAATRFDTGLLINFAERVSVKRKFRIYKPSC